MQFLLVCWFVLHVRIRECSVRIRIIDGYTVEQLLLLLCAKSGAYTVEPFDSGPSEIGTQYNRPLYKGHRPRSQKLASLYF